MQEYKVRRLLSSQICIDIISHVGKMVCRALANIVLIYWYLSGSSNFRHEENEETKQLVMSGTTRTLIGIGFKFHKFVLLAINIDIARSLIFQLVEYRSLINAYALLYIFILLSNSIHTTCTLPNIGILHTSTLANWAPSMVCALYAYTIDLHVYNVLHTPQFIGLQLCETYLRILPSSRIQQR